jgi:hypothetical protein
VADVEDSRARGHALFDRPDVAVPAFLRAAEGYDQAGDRESAGHSTMFAAQLLAGAERLEEAVSVYRSAIDLLEGQDRAAAEAELAEVLDRLS